MHTTVERALGLCTPAVARSLDRALSGHDLSIDEAAGLFDARGRDLHVLTLVADELRRQQVGEIVTYVVNRNINFTNVCVKRCGFCAFSRDQLAEEGYLLPIEEIVRRAREAWELGATEICVQAGLPPGMDGWLYVNLCRAVKRELPDIHIHGFSPEEVLYGARRARVSIREYLLALKEAGVGSLPGTSAEILDDALRQRISPGRISVAKWREVIQTAHVVGIPTTSTIMFGHLETSRQRAAHLALLREIQRETHGFTEFVPLAFVHQEAPMFAQQVGQAVPAGPSGDAVVAMYAVARLMLGRDIPNLQVSWVKQGLQLSQHCLGAGANDYGGTLINESISTAAGATHGQLVRPGEMRRLIRDAGRIPAERTTTYQLRRVFEQEPAEPDPLDRVDAEQARRFGSYQELIRQREFRFAPLPRRAPVPLR
ncbi:MAG: 5-amino-6-(D-ribitylamino)uracil--L-tyrosine 4-hydroxyphenyl transferase CofH [Chloroflexi bacterium]|nr:5-amino-6-(D-ribitylamino)uracil--L-tyrosine 4-hydroxyphenyl transferase CofH [Chloroflexota bacterium]